MIEVEYIGKQYIVPKEQYGLLNQKKIGEKNKEGYILDEYETAFLLENKKISLKHNNKKLTFKDLTNKKRFNNKEYIVFKDLRSKGHIPKTGLKYGVTFRLYEKGSNLHAKFLVDVVSEKDKISYRELSGKNRISHSTKKNFLFAIVDNENSITYIQSNWTKL